MELRLGQLLIENGVLDQQQVTRVLNVQDRTGEPFGLICERLFRVDPEVIEETWAQQYAQLSQSVDPIDEEIESEALESITRRQAWQFRVLPLRYDDRELVMVTTHQHLRRALRFATNVIGVPVYFVLTEPQKLGDALCRHYPIPGLSPDSVDGQVVARIFDRRERAA